MIVGLFVSGTHSCLLPSFQHTVALTPSFSVGMENASLEPLSVTMTMTAETEAMNTLAVRWLPLGFL